MIRGQWSAILFDTPLRTQRAGEVCISILHPPGNDAFGYERSCERWSPVQSVEKILLSVRHLCDDT